MIRRLATSLLLITVVTVGCRQYHPAEPRSVARGSEMRVRLTAEGQKSLAQRTVRFERELEGSLLRARSDSVWIVSPRGGGSSASSPAATIRDTLALPRAHIETVEKEETSVLRTAGLIGGGAVGIGIVALTTTTTPQGTGSDPESGDSGEASISIPISIP